MNSRVNSPHHSSLVCPLDSSQSTPALSPSWCSRTFPPHSNPLHRKHMPFSIHTAWIWLLLKSFLYLLMCFVHLALTQTWTQTWQHTAEKLWNACAKHKFHSAIMDISFSKTFQHRWIFMHSFSFLRLSTLKIDWPGLQVHPCFSFL